MAKVKYIKLSDALEMLQKTDGGAPRNWTHIKTFRDEIIGENEVPALLKKYGLISEEDEL